MNIRTGKDTTIRELAQMVTNALGFQKRNIVFDTSKTNDSPVSLSMLPQLHNLGWHHTTSFDQGIRLTWKAFVQNNDVYKS